MNDLFDPVEHAILCDFFGVERPEALRDVDAFAGHGTLTGGVPAVRVEPDSYGKVTASSVSNAVARLLLHAVQERLPPNARTTVPFPPAAESDPDEEAGHSILFFSYELFEVEWAMHGGNFVWLERYHAVYAPGFRRYVVTISAEQRLLYGYEHIAIGFFGQDVDVRSGATQVVTEWWQDYQHRRRDTRWACVLSGLISPREVLKLRDTVWPPPAPDPDDDWAESWAFDDDDALPGRVLQ